MASKPKPKGGPRLSIIPARAVTDPDITAQALRVLALLGRHTDDQGWCCRSQVRMAEELSCGRGTIQRGIDQLVEAGYVEKVALGRGKIPPPEEGMQPFAAFAYRVILDQPGAPEGVPTGGHGGAHSDGHRVPTQAGTGCPDARAPLTERPLVNGPLITKSAVPPRAPDRRGDPALWTALVAKAEPEVVMKLDGWGAVPISDGARVVVDFEKDWVEKYVGSMRRKVQAAIGVPTVFRYAGREGQL